MILEDGPIPRYIMVGGFLGAGKTTAVAQLARYLTDQGLRVRSDRLLPKAISMRRWRARSAPG